ncbi:MAG: hypothetical protein KQH63_21140 [Desulfobulbaceae bacterium]|nr:hypothetical protein [Desulfobulbaceae bacterium]
MNNQQATQKKYTFALSSFYIFFVNNIGKICIGAATLLALLPFITTDDFRQEALFFGIGFFLLLPIPVGYLLSKFANKVVVDFEEEILVLHMNRTGQIVRVGFNEIENISTTGYIVFKLKEKKILYNNAGNADLIACLNKIKASQR